MPTNSSAAKDGGANQSKTTMPPVSQEYRENYDAIFGKSKRIENNVVEIPNGKIICLTGFATSGKDTFLKLLQISDSTPFIPTKFARVAFADKLKETTAPYIKSLYNIDIFNCTPAEKEIVRPILIAVGCWVRDYLSDTYWVDQTIEQIKKLISQGYIPVITDGRFLSEIFRLKKEFGDNNVIGVEIIRTDSTYKPPAKELEQQPLLRPFIDYTVNWPTVGAGEIDKLQSFAVEFIKKYNLA